MRLCAFITPVSKARAELCEKIQNVGIEKYSNVDSGNTF